MDKINFREEPLGIDVEQLLIDHLNKELTLGYISDIMTWYPGLFEQRGDEFFFNDELKFIYGLSLLVRDMTLNYDISPMAFGSEMFKLTIPKPDLALTVDDFRNKLFVPLSVNLSDDICMKFFNHGFNIHGYDREAIMRRYTINNIIND